MRRPASLAYEPVNGKHRQFRGVIASEPLFVVSHDEPWAWRCTLNDGRRVLFYPATQTVNSIDNNERIRLIGRGATIAFDRRAAR